MARICKLLVVEDNDGIREFLQFLFDEEGYDIALVGSGEEMRTALGQDQFDVALIDVTLPGPENGFALAEVAEKAGCGVILVTGDTRHFESVETSGHRYIFKPFRVEHLLQILSELIDESKDCIAAHRRQRL